MSRVTSDFAFRDIIYVVLVPLFGSLPKPKQNAVAMATTTHQQKMMANEKNKLSKLWDPLYSICLKVDD